MGGLVGIIGDGSAAEVTAMAARMSYRGRARTWSPAPGVYLGELGADAGTRVTEISGCFAFDTVGNAAARTKIEQTLTRGGKGAAVNLPGFFAIARWNAHEKTLDLICDRHRYKTLYVARLRGRTAFASDCKALLALPEFPATVDRDVLQTYLRSRSFSSERSLLAAAKPIGGANVWTLSADHDLKSEAYWKPVRRTPAATSFDASALELRAILQAAVQRQLRGRSRMALALSGGLDSAAVLAIARNVRPDLAITTYTVGHSEEDPEIVLARTAAEHFGTEHRECFLAPEEIPAQLRRLVWLTEDLTGREEAALQQCLISEMSGREREYLVGHGADAAFAGMPRHRLLWMRDHAPPPLRAALHELFAYTQSRSEPPSWIGRQLAALAFHGDRPALPRVCGTSSAVSGDPEYASLDDYRCATISGKNEGMRFHEPLETAGEVAMLAPFFDPAVLDFALACPTHFLIDARRQKRILRAAVQGMLPESMSRRPKIIQRMKHDAALSAVLDSFAGEIGLAESLRARGLVPAEYVKALQKRERAAAYSSERLHILWALISAELWLRQFVDQRGLPEVAPRAATARAPMAVAATANANQPAPSP